MKKKILIVDDTLHVLEEVRDILEMENFEVLIASSAIEAMLKLSKETPDLVITDLRMPGLTGFDLLGKAKSIHSKDIPVIVLSANADKENIKKAISLKASRYLKKPCSADELIETVRTII